MFANPDSLQKKSPVRILLDGQAVSFDRKVTESLAAIRTQLELAALRKERVLSVLRVDGVEVSLIHPPVLHHGFKTVEAESISLLDYSRILLRRVQDQVHLIRRRLEALVLLVLINDSRTIDWLWRGLLSDLQVPLIKLGFLQEFFSAPNDQLEMELRVLNSHWQEFRLLWQRLEGVYALRDNLALSDALEHDLLPWVMRLQRSLTQLARFGFDR
ncbi:MAG TPA: hypothetical protein P5186_12380 [Candidatus Paceibacterota bacterium]|nr:hypothetical protein [Verrucomicrobiota bacterium]HRY48838.1 hypothetical protein [Candidatus Paceibacterota bacterium]HSA03500.1 hypothetical protein [Candidatus Paceibacterota bacterium]